MLTCNQVPDGLALEGELQVAFLERLKDALAPALDRAEPLTLDVSGISEIDVAGLQLVLAFLRSRHAETQTRLVGAGEVFKRALDLTGMAEHYAPFMG